MAFTVTKSLPVLVTPSEPTPPGNLPLSSIDRTAAVRGLVDMMLVYAHGDEPAAAVKTALSKALVAYYPIAGRLVEPKPGELDVACTADGVWFVEVSTDCTLRQVNNLELLPRAIPNDDLLPLPPPEVDLGPLIFMIQVTQFGCGGFVLGIKSSHVVLDGLGAVQFLNAIAEMARGFSSLSAAPAWSRESIPGASAGIPPRSLPLPMATFPFVTVTVDIFADLISQMKKECQATTFDVLTALFWQSRTRVVGLDAEDSVRLGFAANVRNLLTHLPPGYYGNCVFPVSIAAASGRIASAALAEVVGMVREAKDKARWKFADWATGQSTEDPFGVPAGYGTCVVADWSKLGFWELDYGWGDPLGVVPMNDESNMVASCILLRPPAPALGGVRLFARCVIAEHVAAFIDQVNKLTCG